MKIKTLTNIIIGLTFITMFSFGYVIGNIKGSIVTGLAMSDEIIDLSTEKCEELNYYETFTSVEPEQLKHYQEERVEVMTKELIR